MSWLKEFFTSGALGYLIEGGIFMWPILLLGILALAVIIERWRSLKMLQADAGDIKEQALQLLGEDRTEEALELCEKAQGPTPAILASGLRKYLVLRRLGYDPARVEDQVLRGMEGYSAHVIAALERHLPILATVSSAAPMVGFLGTVQGMIVSFKEIVASAGKVNIVEAAAAGIQVALLTTCFGLIVGIPAYMAYNYFTGLVNQYALEVEESAADLVEAVTVRQTLERNS